MTMFTLTSKKESCNPTKVETGQGSLENSELIMLMTLSLEEEPLKGKNIPGKVYLSSKVKIFRLKLQPNSVMQKSMEMLPLTMTVTSSIQSTQRTKFQHQKLSTLEDNLLAMAI